MILLQKQYQYFQKYMPEAKIFSCDRFTNQEIKINCDVKDQNSCYIVGSLLAPDAQVLELLRCMHYLHVKGVKTYLFSPYFGYQRQDDDSYGLAWACDMLKAAFVNQIVAIQLHNPVAQSLHQVKSLNNVPMMYFFNDIVNQYCKENYSIIFPDQNAYKNLYEMMSYYAPKFGWFVKERTHAGILLKEFHGKAGQKVCLVDDILDSGQTLVQACIRLKEMGVTDIVVFVAHAFFHGRIWNDLWSLGVKKIYCLDSLPQVVSIDHPYVQVVSVFSQITLEKLFRLKV